MTDSQESRKPEPISNPVELHRVEQGETFDELCREHDITGTAMASLAYVFFEAGRRAPVKESIPTDKQSLTVQEEGK
jgi:diketogulonate reductase-like aldo/keto reductase